MRRSSHATVQPGAAPLLLCAPLPRRNTRPSYTEAIPLHILRKPLGEDSEKVLKGLKRWESVPDLWKSNRDAIEAVKSSAKLESGEGYICSTCSSHKAHRAGALDFLAAYVVLEDAWYIIPAKEIRGLKSVSSCTQAKEAKYEGYREAWHLLREASEICEESRSGEESAEVKSVASHPTGALARLETATNYCKRCLERGGVPPHKQSEDV
jgi:hypothetical protein